MVRSDSEDALSVQEEEEPPRSPPTTAAGLAPPLGDQAAVTVAVTVAVAVSKSEEKAEEVAVLEPGAPDPARTDPPCLPPSQSPLEQTPPSVLAALANGFAQREKEPSEPSHKIRVDFKVGPDSALHQSELWSSRTDQSASVSYTIVGCIGLRTSGTTFMSTHRILPEVLL